MADDVYAEASAALLAAVAAEVGPWVERCILERAPELATEAAEAARRAGVEVMERLTALVEADIDAQRTTPLQVIRDAVRYPTAVLEHAGVTPARRDPWALEAEPADLYGLTPASWADVGPASGEAGLVWGAAKAMRHLARRRAQDG